MLRFAENPGWSAVGLGVLGALAWAAAWPILGADLVIDDLVYQVTARWVERPLSAFWTSHFYEPLYFRPVGLITWWLVQRLAEEAPQAQFATNLALHVANAILLAVVLRAVGVGRRAVLVAASVASLGPATLTAALWPSNRFDLLAVFWLLSAARLSLAVLARSAAAPQRRSTIALFLLAMVAAVLACFSKELAYPVVVALALVVSLTRRMGEVAIDWRIAVAVGLSLLVVALGCAAWRHVILPHAYAAVPADPLTAGWQGLLAWVAAFVEWSDRLWPGQGWTLSAVVFAALATSGWFCLASPVLRSRALAVAILGGAAILPQLALAGGFAVMLNGEPLGTVSYARFFYAPWVVMAALLAVGSDAMPPRLRFVWMVSLAAGLVLIAFRVNATAEMFRQWSTGGLREVTREAALVMERVVTEREDAATLGDCVVVFLDTASADAGGWFARFSDVATKANSRNSDRWASCHVMTETTPFVFVRRATDEQPSPVGLVPIINPDGRPKVDQSWDGVRYRYRLPPPDLSVLQSARFFVWRMSGFVEITQVVREGRRPIASRGW